MDTESFNLFRLVPGRVARTSTLSTTATRAINLSDTLISSAKFCPDFHPRRWPSLGEETAEKEPASRRGAVNWTPGVEICSVVSKVVIERVPLYTTPVTTSLINVFSKILLTSILFSLCVFEKHTVYYRQLFIGFFDLNKNSIIRDCVISRK